MADAALDVVIGQFIVGLAKTIVKECTYIYNFQRNVKAVEDKVGELESVERDVDKEVAVAQRGAKDMGGNIMWLQKEVSEIKGRSGKVVMSANKVRSGFLKGRLNIYQRFLLSRKAEQLNADIAIVLAQGRQHVKVEHGSLPAGMLQTSPSAHSVDLESRVKLTNKVMEALLKDGIYMIGIRGMAGVGKTTLADDVMRIVLEKKLFETAVKVEVSDELNIPLLQKVIAESIGLELKDFDEDGKARRLRSRLTDGTKNLVILDNIWDPVPLGKVGLPLQGEEKGCKVIFTTRKKQIFLQMKVQVKINVKQLSDPEARKLFKNIAEKYEEEYVDKVADECGGLPLAINTVASALGGRIAQVWESALDKIKELNGTETPVYSSIKLSYDLLKSNEAKRLLLLCCLFPEGVDIPKQKLVRYVMGLQLIEVSNNISKTSCRVSELLDDLKSHSLLLRGDKETTVKMNHVVRAVCLSISSTEKDNRLKVQHKPKLMHWPKEELPLPYIGISLTFDDQMQQLPDGLVYPGLELLQLQFHSDCLNMSEDFFNEMKEVRVLDFKRMALWGKFIKIDALPPVVKFLINLRTLCMEFCDLSDRDLSLIGSLKHLEVLSFFCSKLVNLPFQIQQLTNLKLLDLRCAGTPPIIPSNVLPALTKLEELYLGNYDAWSDKVGSYKGCGISITELSSLPLLKVLQVRVKFSSILLELKEESWFERLTQFQIEAIRKEVSFHEYEIGKSITFDGVEWNSVLDAKIHSLLKITEYLKLISTSFTNLFSVCSNLQTLDLYGGENVKFIMDTWDSADTLNKLKCLDVKRMEHLEAMCDGVLPSNSLINLETIKLDELSTLTHLWRAPLGSGCLVNLRVLNMSYCDAITYIFPFSIAKGLVQLEKLDIMSCEKLEWIVSWEGEEIAGEKIVLEKLSYISLDDLQEFRSFFPDSGVKTLTEISATVEENQATNETEANNETQCFGCLTRKKKAPHTREPPVLNTLPPTLKDIKQEVPQLFEDNVASNTEPLFKQLVELPSMNKLMVRSMNYLEHIVDDQTSRVSFSKIRNMYVSKCEQLLSLAASEFSIRSLQNLEKVNVEKCALMQAMFDFGKQTVCSPNAEPMLDKLETVTLNKLNGLKHVFWMVPEGTPCFMNLRSLEISGCGSLSYVLSVSAAKMLGNLQDLKVKGSAMVKEIIEIDGGCSEVTDTITFSCLTVLELVNLDRLTSFSSGNHSFVFPQLEDLLISECPSMNRFCGGQVKARILRHVRVGEHLNQRESIKNGLNITIRQLYGERVESASAEIVEL